MNNKKKFMINRILFGLSLVFSCNLMASTVFDWRTNSTGSGSVGGTNYISTAGGITVTASAHVAELSGSSSQVFGPFSTSTNANQFGFLRNNLGLGLQIDSGTTQDPISGTERGSGLIRPGFNSDPYVSGNSSIEAMNFALFEFDSLVNLNSLTLDGVSNFSASAWLAVGNTAPNLNSSITDALNGFSIFSAPDTIFNGNIVTTTFNFPNSFKYLLIGSPPTTSVAGITGPSGQQFYIQSFDVTASPVPVPAAIWLFGSGLIGLFGASKRRAN